MGQRICISHFDVYWQMALLKEFTSLLQCVRHVCFLIPLSALGPTKLECFASQLKKKSSDFFLNYA